MSHCGPQFFVQFDRVALPAIIDYKLTEARCEKLPRLLPPLFSEVPEAEQLRRYAVLHQKWKQSLFDIFMELGGARDGSRPHGAPPACRLTVLLRLCGSLRARRLLLQDWPEDRIQHRWRRAQGVLGSLPALFE